jgi:hypothetical protein
MTTSSRDNPKKPHIPPEPRLSFRVWYTGLEHHATSVGYVCITFANLEYCINQYIPKLLSCSWDSARAIMDATGTSFQARCDLVLKLASISHPSDEWFSVLEAHLNTVKNEICPLRNRLVHDVWSIGGAEIQQWDIRAPLKKPQSRAKPQISPIAQPERSLESIWDLVRVIWETEIALHVLRAIYETWKTKGRTLDIPPRYAQPSKLRPPSARPASDEGDAPPPQSSEAWVLHQPGK